MSEHTHEHDDDFDPVPTILIVVQLESAPKLLRWIGSDEDGQRLADWVARPGNGRVGRALTELLAAIADAEAA